MKKYLVIIGSLIILGVSLVIIAKCKRRNMPAVVIVTERYLDSLKKAAEVSSRPADTVEVIIWKKANPVYIEKKIPIPIYLTDSTLKVYQDSLMNSDISAKVKMTVRGTLKDLAWTYNPIYRESIKTIYEQVPVPTPYEVPTPQSGLYGIGGIGKGNSSIILSAGVMYQNKKGRMVGVEAGNFSGNNYVKLNIGIKF